MDLYITEQGETTDRAVFTRCMDNGGSLEITLDGHTQATCEDDASIIMLEVWEGELRLVVWADINQEDPTHIIPLTEAEQVRRL